MSKVILYNSFKVLILAFLFSACGSHGAMDGNMTQMGNKTQEMLSLDEQHHDEVMEMQDPTEMTSVTENYATTMSAKINEMMSMNDPMMGSHDTMDEQDAMQIQTNCTAMQETIDQHLATLQSMSQADLMREECLTHYQKMQGFLGNMQSIMQSYGTMPMMK